MMRLKANSTQGKYIACNRYTYIYDTTPETVTACEECMCHLQNIAMRDYQESVTTGQTHTDGQILDKVIPTFCMCRYASQVTQKFKSSPFEVFSTIDIEVSWNCKVLFVITKQINHKYMFYDITVMIC